MEVMQHEEAIKNFPHFIETLIEQFKSERFRVGFIKKERFIIKAIKKKALYQYIYE